MYGIYVTTTQGKSWMAKIPQGKAKCYICHQVIHIRMYTHTYMHACTHAHTLGFGQTLIFDSWTFWLKIMIEYPNVF